MNEQVRVLHVTPSFYPAIHWGGPIFSLYGLCNALTVHHRLELRVLTTDTAGPKLSQKVNVSGYPINYEAGYEVYFCPRIAGASFSPRMFVEMPRLIRWADVVHLTGTYSFPTVPTLWFARRQRKPVVWSPRGALQAVREWPGARNKTAKRVFEKLCDALIRRNKVVLHVTSADERRTSELAISATSSVIIPNGVDIPETLAEKVWIPNGQLRILFISRVDPKKGLEILIDALQLLKDPTISVDVCGSGDPGYIAHLQALVEKYRLGKCVHFLGHVDGENKTRAFGQADICVLPSHSENFGMVIAESLAHGVPVITTRMTPWQELQSHDCGLWIDNQADVLAHAITEIRRRDLAAMGARGREWMRRDFSWGMIAARMQRLYEDLASDGIDRTNSISSGGT